MIIMGGLIYIRRCKATSFQIAHHLKDLRKREYGYKAVAVLVRLAFKEYGLHRLETKMRADNIPSIEFALLK
jgi:RimJ/RimL family protein N-acetyltransferase